MVCCSIHSPLINLTCLFPLDRGEGEPPVNLFKVVRQISKDYQGLSNAQKLELTEDRRAQLDKEHLEKEVGRIHTATAAANYAEKVYNHVETEVIDLHHRLLSF